VIQPNARGAWDELEGHLRPFVARRIAEPSDVDDVLQDIYLRIQAGVGSLRDSERFGPWVYQVARSALADHGRARARHPLPPTDPTGERAAAPPATADSSDESAEQALAKNIAVFVAALPSPYREAITLTELEGMSQKDAAEMLGISLSGMSPGSSAGDSRSAKCSRRAVRSRSMPGDACCRTTDARMGRSRRSAATS
jgi:RNA polymerase sigma-70 factor (ECF subfamily)